MLVFSINVNYASAPPLLFWDPAGITPAEKYRRGSTLVQGHPVLCTLNIGILPDKSHNGQVVSGVKIKKRIYLQ
jgi:hypothetical protein